jgi:glycerophosphotransferase
VSKFIELYKWAKAAFIYRINKNKKRNKALWIFGCWGGMKYSDNSKYLFEYVCKEHPEIRAVWITVNKSVYEELISGGKEVYLANTPSADEIIKQAGVAFFTNSLNDFGDNPLLNGAKICALFHGVGFKDELRELENQNTIKAKVKWIKHKIYDLSYTSFIFTTSEFLKRKFYIQQYNASLDRIILTGQPRNDLFFDIKSKEESDFEKNILYMPTFREDKKGQDLLRVIVNNMANSNVLNKLLEQYGYKLIIKPHYLTTVEKNNQNSNILIYNDVDIPDIQKFLKKTDVLITDYSSVISDFVLLNRPILFFSYDLEEYIKLKPINSNYNNILTKTYVDTLEELIKLLRLLFENKVDYQSVNDVINEYMNAPSLRQGGYSKNICDYMISYLNLK